jgi:hypothetical protein
MIYSRGWNTEEDSMRLRESLLLGLVLLVPCAPRAQAQNLVLNPEFNLNSGSSAPDWTISGLHAFYEGAGSADSVFSTINPAAPASFFAALAEGGTNTLSQNVGGLIVGDTYNVSFSLASSVSDGSLTASLDGQTLNTIPGGPTGTQAAAPGPGYAWSTYTSTITYSGATNLLSFTGPDDDVSTTGFYITNVQVINASPPPPTLLATLAGGALGGLRMLRARRRKAA